MRHRLFLLIVLLAVISYLRSPAALVTARKAADDGKRLTADDIEKGLFNEE